MIYSVEMIEALPADCGSLTADMGKMMAEQSINEKREAISEEGRALGLEGWKERTAFDQESSAFGKAYKENRETEGSLLRDILEVFPGKNRAALSKGKDIRTYSPLALAYIGDGVYDLIIRTVVVDRANRPANELHRITVKYVSAPAQSRMIQALIGNDSLTEEERDVYRRGKNSKPHTTAKNATHADYMKATGFEALLGYLYLKDNMDRVLELVRMGMELTGMEL